MRFMRSRPERNSGLAILLPFLLFFITGTATAQSTGQNYIRTRSPLVKITEEATLNSQGANKDKVQTTIQYFDGLGRPLQTVQRQGSPSGNDLVQPIEYDAFGREAKKYLPYTAAGTDGSYRADALGSSSAQKAFYLNPPSGVVQVPAGAYSETVFEASPLNRVTEQGAPGTPWQIGTGHTVKTAYGTNAGGEVKLWTVTGTGATAAGYSPGTLYKTTTTDENGNAAIEYKDLQGRVVSKKVQSGAASYVTTDYIYDDLGNLRYVLPPLPLEITMPASFSETDQLFLNFFYGYHYDGRRRQTEKKVPGKGWQYLVYNKLDQVVLMQDALQRQSGIWLFSKYDGLGRVVMSGEYSSAAGRQALQDQVNQYSGSLRERYEGGSSNYGYSNQSYPATYSKVLTVNYYDRYDFLTGTAINPNTAVFAAPSSSVDTLYQQPIGLQTGSLVNVTGTANYLLTVNQYDLDGRAVKTISQHYQGGSTASGKYDITENLYSFTGQVLQQTRRHYNGSSPALSSTTQNSYDHMGRKLQERQSITGADGATVSAVVPARYDYNELGQLYKKYLHSQSYSTPGIVPAASFLYPLTYSYNARGWLKGISSAEFSETINYEDGGRYNGDITSVNWTINGSSNTFAYSYDAMNRLNSGTASGMGESGISYDNLGNILGMTRDGQSINYDYVYDGVRGNRLNAVSGSYFGGTKYFRYDDNGNLTQDDSRGISSISYNHLNLPQLVSSSSGTLLSYSYTADGEKVRSYNSRTGTSTDYIDGIQYENNDLKVVLNGEGQARRSGNSYNYEYWVKDHLGNTRVAFYRNPSTGQMEVLQREDYYPFGKNRQVGILSSNKTNYLYNGKELQEGFDLVDFGARLYDPVIGRFGSIDPKAEEARRYSTYIYAIDNPMRFVDINGEGPGDRVKAARQMIGSSYRQESGILRTGLTKVPLSFKDCSEFVNRVLAADGVTNGISSQNTATMTSFFGNDNKFIHSMTPKAGDIALWKGHVGIVGSVDKNNKIKLIHASGSKKPANENPYYITPAQYKDSEFYGYYRPVNETPDGKLDDGNIKNDNITVAGRNSNKETATNNTPSNPSFLSPDWLQFQFKLLKIYMMVRSQERLEQSKPNVQDTLRNDP